MDFIGAAKRKRNAAKIAKKMKRIGQSGTQERHNFLIDIALQSKRDAKVEVSSSNSREPLKSEVGSLSVGKNLETKSPLQKTRSAEVVSSSADKSGVIHSISVPCEVEAKTNIADARADEKVVRPLSVSTLSRQNAEKRKLLRLEESLE